MFPPQLFTLAFLNFGLIHTQPSCLSWKIISTGKASMTPSTRSGCLVLSESFAVSHKGLCFTYPFFVCLFCFPCWPSWVAFVFKALNIWMIAWMDNLLMCSTLKDNVGRGRNETRLWMEKVLVTIIPTLGVDRPPPAALPSTCLWKTVY